MSGFLRWYQSVLNRRPLLTQMISSGTSLYSNNYFVLIFCKHSATFQLISEFRNFEWILIGTSNSTPDSGLISSSGDLISQFVLERRSWQQYDGWRTAKFFCLAGCFVVSSIILLFQIAVFDHPIR